MSKVELISKQDDEQNVIDIENDMKKAKKKKSHKPTIIQEVEIIEAEVVHVVDTCKNHKKQSLAL